MNRALIVALVKLSALAGIDLYMTTAAVGLGIYFGKLHDLPAELHILGQPLVIAASCIMFLIEFIVEKIPVMNQAWNTVQLFIKPIAAIAIIVAATLGLGGQVIVVAFLLGGGATVIAMIVDWAVWLLLILFPEPVTYSIITIVEDVVIGWVAITTFR